MNYIEAKSLDSRLKRFEKPLVKTVTRVFDYLRLQDVQLEIYIINASKMRKLNLKYRGLDKPTDVLAVEQPDFPKVKNKVLGEIYLCPAQVKKKPYTLEYALLHGVLHLLGFNHDVRSDKIKMEKEENKILEWLDHTS